MNFKILMFLIGTFAFSILLTYFVRIYTLKQHILDIPNERSSHVVATPRGGGLGFVVVFLLGLSILCFSGIIGRHLFLALVGGGAL
ncbi:MAG TPA: glycosyl transferase, partial [Syntrophomonas sp.]|nr:glycosyl transferase [Syntrophomonas sp.]